MCPESALVVKELKSRGVTIITYSTEDILYKNQPFNLTKNDLVVGDFKWVHMSLKQLGIPIPDPPDYPKCLEHLLHRKIWISTLGEVETYCKTAKDNIFLKPAKDAKDFNGLIEPKDGMLWYVLEKFPRDYPVACSELIDIVSEYRVYVVNCEIKGIC